MFYLRNVGLFAIAQMVSATLAFLYTVLVARYLGVEKYGLFQALMSFYGLCLAVTVPLNLATVHCVATTEETKQPKVVGDEPDV